MGIELESSAEPPERSAGRAEPGLVAGGFQYESAFIESTVLVVATKCLASSAARASGAFP